MKKKNKILAMLMMLAVLINIAATPATSSAAETAKEYLDNMAAASATITSSKVNVKAVANLKSYGKMTFSLDETITSNPVAISMNMNMDLGLVMGVLLGQQTMDMQMYIAPDATGAYWEYINDGTMWVKQKMDLTTTDINTVATTASGQFDTSMISKLKIKSESTMVGDKECVAIAGQITGKTIWKELGKVDKSYKKEFKAFKKCKPVTFTYYIDKATNYPVKLTVGLNAFIKGYLKADKEMKEYRKEFKSVSLEMNYSDINAVPAIVVPQEALNAIDSAAYDTLGGLY